VFLATVSVPAEALAKPGFTAWQAGTGHRQWITGGSSRNFVGLFATPSTVFVARSQCEWEDKPYEKGASELVAFDADSGNELWSVDDVASASLSASETIGAIPRWLHSAPYGTIPVYTKSKQILRGLSPRSGRQRWKIRTDGLEASAADRDHLVLAPPSEGSANAGSVVVRMISRHDGKTQWEKNLPISGVVDNVSITNGLLVLIVGAQDRTGRHVVVLDINSGRSRHDVPLGRLSSRFRDLQLQDDIAVLPVPDGMVGFDVRQGQLLWHRVNDGAVSVSPTHPPSPFVTFLRYSSGSVNIPNVTQALDGRTGMTLWTLPDSRQLYASKGSHALYVQEGLWHDYGPGALVNSSTGRVRWTHEFSDDEHFLMTSDTLYVGGGCPSTLRD
jgi:outer membrane protein assembly factor BamB